MHAKGKEYAIPFLAACRIALQFPDGHNIWTGLIDFVVVHEIMAVWWRTVVRGGIILASDRSGNWRGVTRAVHEHAAADKLQINIFNSREDTEEITMGKGSRVIDCRNPSLHVSILSEGSVVQMCNHGSQGSPITSWVQVSNRVACLLNISKATFCLTCLCNCA